MSDKRNIDELDAKIISVLQGDGRMSNTDIAKMLDVSEATVRGRIKRLTEDEIIQIVAVGNPLKLGFEITGDLYITVDMKKMDNVIAELRNFRELWYIVATTGRFNLNAEFVVSDLDALNDLVYNRLSHIDGIEQIETSVIMKYIKRRYDFGTPLE
ncbi:MAG TPA: Lrp/AsnC family transcriptional regulator [Spirochaetota bacterium]|nr:Lrp/AsnC family transcriptional regulator [Spirochaetota bacterium]HPF07850.1 Lrp/AsnC family transcriptional regulator [Spirochaetota bacterium]HPJ44106.1 Lrp/AsnC family transcriptional regulator [Spirochaetota bacterium]HPR39244.1 Lrp/AsnC family transcriptional regulator [Spirochaetota bacterium]HRX49290.1 Lrp/AsnC family transcriptional regulator [Spirochaetota bacterium]